MSNEEKSLRNNCYVDFYRAATWYYKNPTGNTHVVFFNHGLKLIQALGDARLVYMCATWYFVFHSTNCVSEKPAFTRRISILGLEGAILDFYCAALYRI